MKLQQSMVFKAHIREKTIKKMYPDIKCNCVCACVCVDIYLCVCVCRYVSISLRRL